MIMICFVTCYSTTLHEDPLSSIVEDSPYINDGGTFHGIIKQSTNHVFSLRSKLGEISSPSLKTFDVDDYGAQGDGKTDDTQVYIFIFTSPILYKV
jgi:galacturan 1,4-alpha-galacturonidase